MGWPVALLGLLACGHASPLWAGDTTYANLKGSVVLENSRVSVESFTIAPGQWTGRHTPHGNQLLVFVHGGVLTSKASGRAVLWRDGRVRWQGDGAASDEGEINSGIAPIELLWVTLKPVPAAAGAEPSRADLHLNYPNIPGEDLLENDYIVVQRFTVGPGAWEGIHAHGPNMLYIHIRGGQWAARSHREPEHPYPTASPDGEVGWMTPVDISAGHESGNIGKTPIDLIWVTLK
jgi:predicted metal-dependent enzyme (double-stranded beta helix superfamily)